MSNGGRFQKGKSGNPRGRPPKQVAASDTTAGSSSLTILLDRFVPMTRNGEVVQASTEEALWHATYKDALAGKAMAIREVLKWILKREQWLAKSRPAPLPGVELLMMGDPDNADEAMLLLGIVDHNKDRADWKKDRAQLLLEPWAVSAALRRRKGSTSLTAKDIDDIKRCTRDDGTIKWPKPGDRTHGN